MSANRPATLKRRGEAVALFLVDQRMPGMTGTAFLAEARRICPDARKVLLTAYADTDAAIQSINEIGLDHYLMKPWDPPEERLFPVLDDLLAAWGARARPPFDGIRVAGAVTIDREWFPELIRECPSITAILVHSMLDRARQFTSSDLRDEKLPSLGRLAAGLAHELNNPASAAVRGAKTLAESQAAAENAARRLGAAGLAGAQLAAIDAVREQCRAPGPALSPLERADREDALAAWLAAHNASERCAAPLAERARA